MLNPCLSYFNRGMAPSLFPGAVEASRKVKVGPLPDGPEQGEKIRPPAPESPTPRKAIGEYISFEEPPLMEEVGPKRTPVELFKVIKDLLTRRFNDVERVFYELDELNSMRLSQEMMFMLLRRLVKIMMFLLK